MAKIKTINGPVLGQEAYTDSYGLGRVTAIRGGGMDIGVTPYCAGYEMVFAAHNVRLVPFDTVKVE